MKIPQLSIIMPCYNCSATLEEAVESCFRQGLPVPFEIVMVDDGSTDGKTRSVMENLAKKHPEIKLVFHERNRGGGAARNTAVEHASAAVIFCLDGDDILIDNTLPKMLAFLTETHSDGVLFAETKFFDEKDKNKTEIKKNSITERPVTLSDLFNIHAGFLTKVNFMYTKKAFMLAGRYPEGNGFDTQNFGTRFLSKGLIVRVCPSTYYMHRRGKRRLSYFVRENREGKMSFNTYLIYEEILHLLSDRVVTEIYNYDVIGRNTLGGDNLDVTANELFATLGEERFFIRDYKKYVSPDGNKIFKKDFSDAGKDNSLPHLFRLASLLQTEGDYDKVLNIYDTIVKKYGATKLASINIQRALLSKKATNRAGVNNAVYTAFAGKVSRRKILTTKVMNKINKKIMPILTKIAKVPKKTYQVGLSFVVSLFSYRVSKKEFQTAYADAKKLYDAHIKEYDYADYIMPSWKSNTDAIEAYFRNDFAFNFLNNMVIRKTMFIYSYRYWKNIQKKLLISYFPKEKLKPLLREYNIGRPMLNDAAYVSSGNSINHLYHLAKFFTETATDPASFHNVIEVGGGYGNMARLCRKLNPEGTYTIIDIPIFSYIQYVYLRTIFGESKIHLLQKNDTKIQPGKINLAPLDNSILKNITPQLNGADLFLSTWALSESNEKMQQTIFNLNYFNAKYLLFGYQKQSDEFTYAEKVTNTTPDYVKIFNKETDYVKDSYYLFSKKIN